jgi:pantothenate kinase
MKYINLFEEFHFDIEPFDVHGNELEVTIDGEDFSFKVIGDEVIFSSDDDYERAFELGVEIDDELKTYILIEFKKMCDKTRMRRFGFFK